MILNYFRFGFDLFGRQAKDGNWLEFRFPFDKELTNPTDYASQIEATCHNIKALKGKKLHLP